ncbi:MAG: aminotransferase class V-fold PLP-dependent enzyme [Candidatus Saccharicenans sp.]|nr:aminotransferase class V-fold PLP-dependent enzyme [Candidatus Saccharicenans sp.]
MTDPDIILSLFSRLRGRFPALEIDSSGQKRLYLNSGAGSLMVDSSIRAMTEAGQLNPMPGQIASPEIATADLHKTVRQLAADFTGARRPEEISFHFSTTGALFNLAFALRKLFQPGKNLLVTDLDHFANITPWETIGRAGGAEIRTARLTSELTLDLKDLLSKVDSNTVLVALTGASNALGTILPLADIISEIKRKSRALVVVDAVHLAPHAPLDVQEFGCDFLAFSGYKIFGPMIGVLYSRTEAQKLASPYRVETNRPEPPYCWEQGMLPNQLLAGLKGAFDYLMDAGSQAKSGDTPTYPRKLFLRAMESIKKYELELSQYFLERWRRMDSPRLKLYGISDPRRALSRTPTFALEILGLKPAEVKRQFWENHRILIADGNHYSAVVVRHLGKKDLNRVSLAHYDGPDSIDRFFDGLEHIIFKLNKSSL